MKRQIAIRGIDLLDCLSLPAIHIAAVVKLLFQIKKEPSLIRVYAPRYRYSIAKCYSTCGTFTTEIYVYPSLSLSVTTFYDGEVVYGTRCEMCKTTRFFIYECNAVSSCEHFTKTVR